MVGLIFLYTVSWSDFTLPDGKHKPNTTIAVTILIANAEKHNDPHYGGLGSIIRFYIIVTMFFLFLNLIFVMIYVPIT